ncbi:MAG: dihydroneopterin aldolase [Sporichthyaceae bacterium]
MDRVALRGLRGFGRHGVLEAERLHGQTFYVDVELGLDTRRAANSDDLADTVDYAGLADRVLQLVEGNPVNLIETLAERIAATALESAAVQEVEVTVHKPDAPVAPDVDDVTVTIMRSRS